MNREDPIVAWGLGFNPVDALLNVGLGTDEVPLPVFVGAMFDRHWAGHTEQLAKIRRAAGLPEAQYTTPTPGETR